jgi:hypothetical protein
MFPLLSEGDLLKIIEAPWIIDKGVLMLKRWMSGFSPYTKSFSK